MLRPAAFVVAATMVAWTGAATAQTATTSPPTAEALTALYACAEISEDAARLACYDDAAGRVRRAQTEGSLVAVDRAQVQEMQRESFGFSLPSIANLLPQRADGQSDEPESVELQVTEVIAHGNGNHTFVMADGQRWTQVEGQRATNVRAGDTIRIRRAAMGSFLLQPSRGGAAHRVRRVG